MLILSKYFPFEQVWNYKLRRCLFTLLGHLDYIRTTFFHHVSCSDSLFCCFITDFKEDSNKDLLSCSPYKKNHLEMNKQL